MCYTEGCKTIGIYNYLGINKERFCKKHKKDGMIDIVNPICLNNMCNKVASYNFPNNKKRLYCKYHKEDGMINVISLKCKFDGCNIRPSFNFPNNKTPLYCKEHKNDEMIDIRHPICKFDGCNIRASFNVVGQKMRIYCTEHKEHGMINVDHQLCKFDGCYKVPSFNYQNTKKGIYCSEHKEKEMINVIEPTCKNDWCDIQINNNKYEGYCLRCYIYMFPEKEISCNYKTKETCIREFIIKEFPVYDWVHDKCIYKGTSLRRPDHFLDIGEQIIIIETDENQHVDYNCLCENKRIMQLSQDVNHKPIIFIRFNPDEYNSLDNKKFTSCWGINSLGLCVIKKNKKSELERRLSVLKDTINYWIHNKTSKTIEIIHLFYDGFHSI